MRIRGESTRVTGQNYSLLKSQQQIRVLALDFDDNTFLYTRVCKSRRLPCTAHNSPITNGDAARAWRRSFTRLVFCAAPSPCETFAVANPVVAARKGNSMIVSTWFDGKAESCGSCSFLGNGQGASGKR